MQCRSIKFQYFLNFVAVVIIATSSCFAPISYAQERSIPNYFDAFSAYLKGDYLSAYKIWVSLANHGDVDAQFNLGTLYDNGLGVKRDVKTAAHWYGLAASSNVVEAQLVFASILTNGEIGSPDVKSAIENISSAANRGFPLAQFKLAVAYDLGLGVTQNYATAAAWYEKAAMSGIVEAKYNLGALYEEGLGVPRDYDLALVHYQEAARGGSNFAENNIGNLYKNGFGVERNYMLAIEWYKKAADGGLAVAQYNLGIMHQLGLGVESNLEVAAILYRSAAIQGYQLAQNNLAILLANGWGVRRDFNEAIKWLKLVTQGADMRIAIRAEKNIKTLSLKLLGDEETVLQTSEKQAIPKEKEVFMSQIERVIPLPIAPLAFDQPVLVLQRILRELGYYNERIDGVRGPVTDGALRLACLEKKLKFPTVISNLFLEKLFKILSSESDSHAR